MRHLKKNLLLILLIGLTCSAFSQTNLALTAESKISITGSSTLHDWKASVNDYEGSCQMEKALSKSVKKGKALSNVQLTFEGSTIDGGRGPAMNGKIKKALKVTEHPQITFAAAEATINEVGKEAFTIQSTGQLSIAGATQTVEIILEGKKAADGTLVFNGSKALKMSDFQIAPPSAMFGQIVTKDDITVNFELHFSKK